MQATSNFSPFNKCETAHERDEMQAFGLETDVTARQKRQHVCATAEVVTGSQRAVGVAWRSLAKSRNKLTLLARSMTKSILKLLCPARYSISRRVAGVHNRSPL